MKGTRARHGAALALALSAIVASGLTSGCSSTSDPGGSSSGAGGPQPGDGAEPTGDAAVVKQAIVASASAFELGEETKILTAKAVFEASTQAGGAEVIATGTLTQQGASEAFTYEPSPSDRLVVVFTDGTRDELWVDAMQGDFTGSADDYLGRDHVFRYRIAQSGDKPFDLQIADGVREGQTESTLEGSYEIDGVSFEADVRRVGTRKSSVEIQFAELTTEEALTGTISGGDLAITLSETYRYRSIASERFLQSTTRTIQDTWTHGGSSYEASATVVKHLEDFKAIEIDTGTGWKAEGTISKDAEPIGELGLDVAPGVVSIYVLVNGQKTVLEATTIAQ